MRHWLAGIVATGLFAPAMAQQGPATFRDCDTCPEMVVVPAGKYVMGTAPGKLAEVEEAAELQPVPITIPAAFGIGRFEVTRAEYAAFIADTGYEPRAGCRTWDDARQGFRDDPKRTWQNPSRPQVLTEAHPVTCLSWAEAREYTVWLARKTGRPYRLPSVAEWEYAARAGTTTLRFWGDDAAQGCDYANSFDLTARDVYPLGWRDVGCADGVPDVASVGQFRPNAFGLHDMIGNVWEWLEDCSSGSYVGRPKDARPWVWAGGCRRRSQRGGGWITGPDRSRSAFHGDGDAEDRAEFAGFRVAVALAPGTGAGR